MDGLTTLPGLVRQRRGIIVLKSPDELARMRQAGRIVATVLEVMREAVRPGVTTGELNALAEEIIRDHGATPSFLHYPSPVQDGPPFPASICCSVNEELVHGIPGSRVLKEGDIVTIDVGAIYRSYHGDAAVTLPVGEISSEARRLLQVTEAALYAGIDQVRPGNRLWDVIRTIQTYVEDRGYNVVRGFQGHGIGMEMHEEPSIPNFLAESGSERPRNVRLQPGMTLAIEPMVVAGRWEARVLDDKWTVVPVDGKLTAHFEHTVAVTDTGVEILTRL